MSEEKWEKDQVKMYEILQKKYEGNSLFESLEDVQLAIAGVMDELGFGNYEIVKKAIDKEAKVDLSVKIEK